MAGEPRIAVRSAEASDVGLVLSLICELAEYERMSAEVVATEEMIRDALFGARPKAEVLIASFEGVSVGFALFFENFSTFVGRPGLYLEDLFVRPEARGHGIGKALLESLAAIALERNCGRLEWSVLDWNESAIAFYRGLGATPMDEWTVFRVAGEALSKLAR